MKTQPRPCGNRACRNEVTGRANKLTCSPACRKEAQRQRDDMLPVAVKRLQAMGEPEVRRLWAESDNFAAWLSVAGVAHSRTMASVKSEARRLSPASADPDARTDVDGRETRLLPEVTTQRFLMERAPDTDRVFTDKDLDGMEDTAEEHALTDENWFSVVKLVLTEMKPQLAMGFKPDLRPWGDQLGS